MRKKSCDGLSSLRRQWERRVATALHVFSEWAGIVLRRAHWARAVGDGGLLRGRSLRCLGEGFELGVDVGGGLGEVEEEGGAEPGFEVVPLVDVAAGFLAEPAEVEVGGGEGVLAEEEEEALVGVGDLFFVGRPYSIGKKCWSLSGSAVCFWIVVRGYFAALKTPGYRCERPSACGFC
jgi:hypothetical protein